MSLKPTLRPLLLLCLAGGVAACTQPSSDAPEPDGPGTTPQERDEHGSEQQPPPTPDPTTDPAPDPTATPLELGLEPHVEPIPERLSIDNTFIAETPMPALTGGTVTASGAGLVVVSDPVRDQVHVVDPESGEVRTVELAAGDQPARAVLDGTRAHVALRGAAAIAEIALDTLQVTRRPACPAPRGLALDPTTGHLLVACEGGDLLTLSEQGLERELSLGADLRDVGFDDAGLWVSRYRSAELLRLDAAGEVLSRTRPANVQIGDPLEGRGFAPTLAARTLSSANGPPLMLHQRAQTSTIQLHDGGYGGGRLCDSGIVHATLSALGDGPGALPILPSTVLPLDLARSPDGSRIAVVAPGGYSQQRAVVVDDPFAGPQLSQIGATRQLALLDADDLSQGLHDGSTPCLGSAPQWEHLFPGEAVAVAFLDDARFVVQVQQPSQLRVFTYDDAGHARLTDVITLSDEERLDTGHQLFHQSAGLGVACASCHGEGHDDGHVWDFDGIGPRRTQSLRGGILGSEPFHWDGDLPDLRALVDEVLVRRMGSALVHDEWVDALGGWIDTLPDGDGATPRDTAAVERGRLLFGARGCAACHGGDAYRGPGSFDVGTGGTFQVPSLIGVGKRLPVMHDGCAQSLHDRFDPACGGEQHGDTADLAPADVDDLVAFLESL